MRSTVILLALSMLGVCHCADSGRSSGKPSGDAAVLQYPGPPFSDAAALESDAQGPEASGEARVMINEINANIANSCDLLELYVKEEGSLKGLALKERTSTVHTWDAGESSEGVLIVIHFNKNTTACNPEASESEHIATDEYPAIDYTTNFDGAYDVYISDTGLVATDNVLSLYSADGSILDAVFLSDDAAGSTAEDTDIQAARVAALGQWTMPDGQTPIGGFIDDTFNAYAVHDLNATSTSALGPSLQRKGQTDHNHRGDWFEAELMPDATFGALNPP
ncbi:MAG: hypothetical protein H6715_01060 [Myxococcales bacterium]|nr:hypothetical protein [Myxococcales bacterium]MCB9707979.1 hypothetical protein [Myxococcales bacterium]